MSVTCIKMPYTYEAEVYPSRRSTIARKAVLRGDVVVSVSELSLGDFDVAFVLPDAICMRGSKLGIEGDRSILWRNGRLFSPLRVGGKPVEPAEAEAAFAEPAVVGKGEAKHPSLLYYEDYALPHVWDGYEGHVTPMSARSMTSHALFEGWASPVIKHSDMADREAAVACRLTDAFASVNGTLYVECDEPVWRLRHLRDRNHQVVLEVMPWPTIAHESFRLDRHGDAVLAGNAGGKRLSLADLSGPIALPRPEALKRNDAVEIGRELLIYWRELRGYLADRGSARLDRHEPAETLDALAHDLRALTIDRAAAAFGALGRLYPDGDYPPWLRLRRVIKRWQRETRPSTGDLFSSRTGGTDEYRYGIGADDHEALVHLED